jgi:hypothetical protein
MAELDVSDVVLDPDFLDLMSLIHRTPVVDQYGKNQLTEQGSPIYGSVQPASGKTLNRLPEALRVANVSSFWIQGKIVSDGSCKYPDIIAFKGKRYQVQVVFDWTNWGAGFCEGTCVAERPA